MFRTSKRRNPVTGATYPWLVPASGVVNQYYFYCVDEDFGPVCVKFSSYFPYTGRVIINGNEYAKRQAAKAGIGFTPLDNAFAAVDDAAAVQAICDGLDEGKITALAAKWLRILPHPFTEDPGAMTSGQITRDLRRLRVHGLICRVPHSFRYRVTLPGLRQALFLTRLTQRFLITGLAEVTDPSPPAVTPLRAAARAYEAAIDDLARQAGLAA